LARLLKKQKQAHSQTSEAVVPKLTAVVDGRRKIKDNPPVLFHFQQNIQNWEKASRDHIAQYRKSLQADRLALFDRYRAAMSTCFLCPKIQNPTDSKKQARTKPSGSINR